MQKVSVYFFVIKISRYDKIILLLVQRNSLGDDRLYIGPGNPGYKLLKDLYKNKIDDNVEVPVSIEGMQGNVLITEECVEENGLVFDFN